MPTGQKLVIWTPDNETKLFHAIIAVHDLKLDYTKVAAVFGKCTLVYSLTVAPSDLAWTCLA